SQAIRTEELTNQVHYAARIPGVREQMVKRQRQMAVGRRIIAEGRDIGTVVFPDADRKFYLDASVQTRAQRRYKELKHKNQESDLEAIGEDIKIRDARDKGREIAPLKKAEDAVCIDTTDLTIDEVVNLIIEKLA
ncbi:MAG: (d)CMP kinase, partial [Candidatus Omnitrophica bacterium]|nr:(d)CMP kinase [Candidatus Omnitrophota bacterium]